MNSALISEIDPDLNIEGVSAEDLELIRRVESPKPIDDNASAKLVVASILHILLQSTPHLSDISLDTAVTITESYLPNLPNEVLEAWQIEKNKSLPPPFVGDSRVRQNSAFAEFIEFVLAGWYSQIESAVNQWRLEH